MLAERMLQSFPLSSEVLSHNGQLYELIIMEVWGSERHHQVPQANQYFNSQGAFELVSNIKLSQVLWVNPEIKRFVCMMKFDLHDLSFFIVLGVFLPTKSG